MKIFLLSLSVVYMMVIAFLLRRTMNKMIDPAVTEKVRIEFYRKLIIANGVPLLLVLIICIFLSISFYDIGLRQIELNDNTWFNIIGFILCGIMLISNLYQIVAYIVNAKFREKAKIQFSEAKFKNRYNAAMNVIIPRSKKEKQIFFGVSLTAGICEEIIWRGFLYYLILTVFPNSPIVIVIVAASILFGFGHIYQGFHGFVQATIIGALYGCLYWAAGSVIPGILLHFSSAFVTAFLLSDDNDIERKEVAIDDNGA